MNSRLYIDYRKARDAYNKRMQEEKEMMMKQLKVLEVIASAMAFEKISRWTEALGFCTFSFMEMLEQTVCDVSKMKSILYDESDCVLHCDCVSEDYNIKLFYNHDGMATRTINVSHVDKITSIETVYQYHVNTMDDGRIEMKLVSIRRYADKLSVHFNICSGVSYVDCGEYSQTIKFKVDRIVNNADLLDAYVNVLLGNTVTDAKSMLQFLVTRFDVTEKEFTEMPVASVSVKRFNRTVSEISYRYGDIAYVTFIADDGVYLLSSNGNWRFTDSKWDITRSSYRSEIWHINGYTGEDYEETLEMAEKTADAVRHDFFDSPLIEFAK